MIFYHILFLLLSRMKVIHIDKTFYPSTAIFQPKTLPALPVERQTSGIYLSMAVLRPGIPKDRAEIRQLYGRYGT